MSPDEAMAEAQAASLAFQAALARMGVETLVEAISLFRRLRPEDVTGTAAGWLDDAITMVLARRRQSQELALAYFRLFRALRTGTTIPDPRDPEPAYVTLDDLRDEFNRLLEDDDRVPDEPVNPTDEGDIPDEWEGPDGETHRNDPVDEFDYPDDIPDDIPIETDWSDEDDPLQDFLDELDYQDGVAEEAIERILTETVLGGYEKDLAEAENLEKRRGPEAAEKAREKARENAVTRASGYSQLVSLNAARGLLNYLEYSDRRVIGYVRVSKTGTPCHFCAVLLSRGFVYKSESSAGGGFNGSADEKYHANCQCFAVPIYYRRDYHSMSLFDQNRDLRDLWDRFGDDDEFDEFWENLPDKHKQPKMLAFRRYWSKRMEAEKQRAA